MTPLQRLRLPLMLLAPVVLIAAAIWYFFGTGRYESTDDANVQAARVAISADVAGRVSEVSVRDNQRVKKGDPLFRLDDAPFRIAAEEAEAQLAGARLQIDALKSNYRQRQAELRSAQDTLAYRQREFERQQRLLASGIASQAQYDRASSALDEARQQVSGAEQQIGAVLANLGGRADINPDRHPAVLQAKARLDRAKLNLSYTVVTAPGDGVVTKVEQLQAGNFIAASTPVFALVSTHDVWIEANFKEVQLTHLRPGQAATVEIDSYPGRTFAAKVVSVSPGTGSQFSMLPPENATGNWVKVVQRLPVRLELDDANLELALRAGLSANVTVDTGYRPGWFGGSAAAAAPPAVSR